jgi:diaminopimelate decarboxylase
MFFHGNSKPDGEIEYAINAGVGYFVVDSYEELDKIDMHAGRMRKIQKVLLRVTPNIDTHTHKKIATGTIDCKFGTPIATGQAENFVRSILLKKNVRLVGLHCHVGSQIFDEKPFCQASEVMADFIADVFKKTGWMPEYLNLGGGFGVRYTEEDPVIDYEKWIEQMGKKLKEICSDRNIPVPAILLEPGRSIVGDAGVTVYSVTSVKEIPEHASYVAIDGGMNDNPRYALYEAKYTMLLANKAKKPKNYRCTVAGRCCESGDLLGENVEIQKPMKGDLLTVLTTGAYNYSMASNYNRNPRPAMVMVRDGRDYLAVRRESFEDLIALDTL